MILKWPGGKRWLTKELAPALSCELADTGIYYEPFCGGAAMYFGVKPRIARLSDSNSSLITFWRTVRDAPSEVWEHMRRWQNCRTTFLRIRKMERGSAAFLAARFLFLSRTAWGGVYRTNRHGQFNVPYGNLGRALPRENDLLDASRALQEAKFTVCDFEKQIDRANRGDVIYLDPPYIATSTPEMFRRYNAQVFSLKDYARLREAANRARFRGAFVALSLADDPLTSSLFGDWYIMTRQRTKALRKPGASGKAYAEKVLFSRPPKYKLLMDQTMLSA
jgi:DNA adenine methylase